MSGITGGPESSVINPKVGEDGKKHIDFFLATRERGILNSMLETVAQKFEESHPDMSARWEYAPPGDNTLVVAREALGFRLVDAKECGDLTASQQKEGLVRHGDLVLMAGPKDLVEAIAESDAKIAQEESQLSDASYRDNVQSIEVKDKDGGVHSGRPIGSLRRTSEVLSGPES
jgi:hypothetical protein